MGFNYNKRTAEHFAKHPLPVGDAPLSDAEETDEEEDKDASRTAQDVPGSTLRGGVLG